MYSNTIRTLIHTEPLNNASTFIMFQRSYGGQVDSACTNSCTKLKYRRYRDLFVCVASCLDHRGV